MNKRREFRGSNGHFHHHYTSSRHSASCPIEKLRTLAGKLGRRIPELHSDAETCVTHPGQLCAPRHRSHASGRPQLTWLIVNSRSNIEFWDIVPSESYHKLVETGVTTREVTKKYNANQRIILGRVGRVELENMDTYIHRQVYSATWSGTKFISWVLLI